MIFERTSTFTKSFKSIPAEIQKIFFEKTALMEKHFDHPSLRVKKIHGVDGIYEASVNMRYRFTFQLIKDGILLRSIGKHNETLGK